MAPHLSPSPGSTVASSAEALASQGWVVLPEPLPAAFVAELAEAFTPLLARHVERADPNRGVNRHQMYLPFEAPFSDPALFANEAVLAVVEAVLGPDVECAYYGSDTPFPGAEHQPVHQDGAPLFPDAELRLPPYAVALNVPLVDVADDNAPLECFAGDARPGEGAEPVRFTMAAGTCLLRDTRIWHRGSPHRGSQPRPMLALLYTRPWYRFVLDRPAMSRQRHGELSERGRRLFRRADITPRDGQTGDRPRLSPQP